MKLTERQEEIINVIKEHQPVRSQVIADKLNSKLNTIRQDLSILTTIEVIDGKPNYGYFIPEGARSITHTRGDHLVEKVMRPPLIIESNSTIYDAGMAIITNDSSTIFVKENNKLIGVITRKGILKATLHTGGCKEMSIKTIMTTTPIYTIEYNETVATAAHKLVDRRIGCLPVMKNNEIVGIISKTDITQEYVKITSK